MCRLLKEENRMCHLVAQYCTFLYLYTWSINISINLFIRLKTFSCTLCQKHSLLHSMLEAFICTSCWKLSVVQYAGIIQLYIIHSVVTTCTYIYLYRSDAVLPVYMRHALSPYCIVKHEWNAYVCFTCYIERIILRNPWYPGIFTIHA